MIFKFAKTSTFTDRKYCFSEKKISWIECSLSVRCGVVGLRYVTDLCFSSFLGSYHSVSRIGLTNRTVLYSTVNRLIRRSLGAWQSITDKEALHISTTGTKQCAMLPTTIGKQYFRHWESQQDSSSWLNILPCSFLGTLLDNQSFRIAASLGRHGLACQNYSRKSRHDTINDLIKRALLTCGFPAHREPTGCNRSDGENLTTNSYSVEMWETVNLGFYQCRVGIADIAYQSYVASTSRRASALLREGKIPRKQSIDSLRAISISVQFRTKRGEDGRNLIIEIGKKLNRSTGEPRSKSFFDSENQHCESQRQCSVNTKYNTTRHQ